MNKLTVLASQNEDWGFFGSIRHHFENQPEAWAAAFLAVAEATGCAESAVRGFLDSRHGRHFADTVADGLFAGHGLRGAIDAAVIVWMNWKHKREPYLLAMVTDAQRGARA